MQTNKSYYAIIPASVRYDNELSANAKLLYGEITALCNEKGFCWANNDYFEELYGVGKRSIQRWIDSLVDRGYLLRNFLKNETGAIVGRCLSISQYLPEGVVTSEEGVVTNDTGVVTKMSYPYDKNDTGVVTKMTPIIIQDNNTINIKEKYQKKSNGFEGLIDEYTDNESLKEAFQAFIEMRKKINKPLTEYALKLKFKDLDKLTSNVDMKVKIVNQSVGNCWQDFYGLRGSVTSSNPNAPAVEKTYTTEQLNALFANLSEDDC